MRKYPLPEDFPADMVGYGCAAGVVGFGTYIYGQKDYCWPDRECTTEGEYRRWEKRLTDLGYEVPERYKDAFVKEVSKVKIPHPSVAKFVEKLPTVEARNKENI